jgi:hypothetical protein
LSQTAELARVKARIKALTEKTVANGCTEAEAMRGDPTPNDTAGVGHHQRRPIMAQATRSERSGDAGFCSAPGGSGAVGQCNSLARR